MAKNNNKPKQASQPTRQQKPKEDKKPEQPAAQQAQQTEPAKRQRNMRPLRERMTSLPNDVADRVQSLTEYLSKLVSPEAREARLICGTVHAALADLRTAVGKIPETDTPDAERSWEIGDVIKLPKRDVENQGYLSLNGEAALKGEWTITALTEDSKYASVKSLVSDAIIQRPTAGFQLQRPAPLSAAAEQTQAQTQTSTDDSDDDSDDQPSM